MRTTMRVFWVAAACLMLAAQNCRAQEKRALLIHISQYQDPTVPSLGVAGADQRDIPVMEEALTKFGFQTRHLENSHASRQQVMSALDEIANTAKPADSIVLYFSGHGAHTDKLFSLCPWDALSKSGQNDVTEGDLQLWLDKLKARNVTLILDCCFSRLGARGFVREMRVKFMGRSDNDLIRDFEQVQIPSSRAVILAAASQNGTAIQANLYNQSDRWIGLFTFYLAKELKKATPTTTFHNLLEDVKQDVQARLRTMSGGQGYLQVPALYGSEALVNRPLFAAVSLSEPPPTDTKLSKTYSTIKEVGNGKVVIPIGKEEGVTVGSEFAVYPNNETNFNDKQHELGKVKVTEVKDNEAVAIALAGTDIKNISPDSHVTMTQYQNDINKNSDVYVRLDGNSDFKSRMKQGLKTLAFVKIVEDAKTPPNLVIKGSATSKGLQAQFLDPDGVTPLDSDAKPYTGRNAAEAISALSPKLNQLAVLRSLIHLSNPNPSFHVTLTSRMPQYVEGENADFTCKTDKDCYVILFALDAFGYPDLLYPSRADQPNLLAAGMTLTLPPKQAGRDNRILTYPVLPPFGKTTVMALAITDQAMAEALKKRLFDLQQPDVPGASGERAIRARQSLQDLQTIPLEAWSVVSLDVLTLSKAEAAPTGARAGSRGGN